MIFYCPKCWMPIEENEKICPECKADIKPLDHKSYFDKLVNALNHPERTTKIRVAYILGELRDSRAIKPLAEVITKADKMEDIF